MHNSSQPKKTPHPLSGRDRTPFLEPVGDISVPAGYAERIIGVKARNQDRDELSQLAAEILKSPVAMRLLSDRVYQLMSEDLRKQRERTRNYGARF